MREQLFSVPVSRPHSLAEDARMLTAGEQDHGMTPAHEIQKPPFFSYVFWFATWNEKSEMPPFCVYVISNSKSADVHLNSGSTAP